MTFANASPRYIWDASGKVLHGVYAGGTPAIATIDGKRRYQSEGARTNRIDALSAWTVRGICTSTGGQADPAGGTGAYLVEHMGVSGANDIKSANVAGTADQPLGVGIFAKRAQATDVWELIARASTANGQWQIDNALMGDGVWERLTADHPAVTVVNPFINTAGGLAGLLLRDVVVATDSDVNIWQPQVPDQVFPSSPIAEATTRAADAGSFTAGQIPQRIRSGKWSTELTTMHASTDLATSEVMYLYYTDANNYLAVAEDGGGNTQIKWVTTSGTVVKTVTYSSDQTSTVTVDFATGDLITAGFTTGDGTTNGTVSDWPATTLYVGSDSTPDNHIFGRMSEPEAA